MLKTTKSSEKLAQKAFRADVGKVVGDHISGKINRTVKNSSKSKMSKNHNLGNLTRVSSIRATQKTIFLIPNAGKTFNFLKQIFIKAPILHHFDLECHIRIETNASGYIIGKKLSYLSINWITSNETNLTKAKFLASELDLAKSKNPAKSKNLSKSDFG